MALKDFARIATVCAIEWTETLSKSDQRAFPSIQNPIVQTGPQHPTAAWAATGTTSPSAGAGADKYHVMTLVL